MIAHSQETNANLACHDSQPLECKVLHSEPLSKASAATRPRMSNAIDMHDRVAVTSTCIEIEGQPTLPVSGEFHYSRVPRSDWSERLALMRASGITMVASYVFWIHHEEAQGQASFDGNLNIAEFVEEADRAGLDVMLRIGPWVHGETRNGGLPDWIIKSGASIRTNDPKYLEQVSIWFRRLGDHLRGVLGAKSNVVAIQIENELFDNPEHIVTLKEIARDAGISAPLWTGTGWGGAKLPQGEVIPLFSAYADGFWVNQGTFGDASFREHFFFSNTWDDPGVGSDQHAGSISSSIRADLDPNFPPATCEMGAGMAAAYHRRPHPSAEDITAVANVKLGNGSAWQGFYMYAGGINPPGVYGMQESHATGYPNDMPMFDYDFHAPIGATGHTNATFDKLRELNTFVAEFGPILLRGTVAFPEQMPDSLEDLHSPRWCVRSDGQSGIVFVNSHQPGDSLEDAHHIRFTVNLPDKELTFPDTPISVPHGTIARFPFRLDVGNTRLEWATVSPVGVISGERPVLVLRTHNGIDPRAAWNEPVRNHAGELLAESNTEIVLPVNELLLVGPALGALVLPESDMADIWLLDGYLYRTKSPLWKDNGKLLTRSTHKPFIEVWDAKCGHFVEAHVIGEPGSSQLIEATRTRSLTDGDYAYGSFEGRTSAPKKQEIDEMATIFAIPTLPEVKKPAGIKRELIIEWMGDVAQLRAGEQVVTDRFWDGSQWRIQLGTEQTENLTLHIMPISAATPVVLDPGPAESVRTLNRPTAEITSLRLEKSTVWEVQI